MADWVILGGAADLGLLPVLVLSDRETNVFCKTPVGEEEIAMSLL